MRASQKRECYWDGFRDALMIGRRNPVVMSDSAAIAYNKGFRDGKRTEKRLIEARTFEPDSPFEPFEADE